MSEIYNQCLKDIELQKKYQKSYLLWKQEKFKNFALIFKDYFSSKNIKSVIFTYYPPTVNGRWNYFDIFFDSKKTLNKFTKKFHFPFYFKECEFNKHKFIKNFDVPYKDISEIDFVQDYENSKDLIDLLTTETLKDLLLEINEHEFRKKGKGESLFEQLYGKTFLIYETKNQINIKIYYKNRFYCLKTYRIKYDKKYNSRRN